MKKTPTKKGGNRKLAEQVYNKLMGEIEPDLLLENIPKIDKKYADETDKQKKSRLKRYKKAYAKYDEKFKEFMSSVHAKSRINKKKALHEEEVKSKQEDQGSIDSLELLFE
jgi:hypothetical protein